MSINSKIDNMTKSLKQKLTKFIQKEIDNLKTLNQLEKLYFEFKHGTKVILLTNQDFSVSIFQISSNNCSFL